MVLPLRVGFAEESAQFVANSMRRIRLGQCVKDISVEEFPFNRISNVPGAYGRTYKISLQFYSINEYPADATITKKELSDCMKNEFWHKFNYSLKHDLRRQSADLTTKFVAKVSPHNFALRSRGIHR